MKYDIKEIKKEYEENELSIDDLRNKIRKIQTRQIQIEKVLNK